MSQGPPLPYTGAISLKNLLQNSELLNGPRIADDSKNKVKKDQFDDFNAMGLGGAVIGDSLWDTDNLIPFTDVNDFKVELLDSDELWKELSALNGVGPLNLLESSERKSPPATTSSQQSPARSPMPSSPVSVSQNSPNLASALMRSPGSSGPGSPQAPKEQFFDKFSTDALVLASVPGEGLFNPGKRKFRSDELKPQPVIKKSRKTFVPEDLKDDRYWNRRQKNNTAAKRSRDAKRIKENQIALRAGFLEEENDFLKKELAKYKTENKELLSRLRKYEPL